MNANDYWNEMYAAACEQRRPFVQLRPRVFLDGNMWCVLYGENIQDGVAAFGDSPEHAAWNFDRAWCESVGQQKARVAAAPSDAPDTIVLRAWQQAFGTMQLTHARARLEAAERQRDALQEKLDEANEAGENLHARCRELEAAQSATEAIPKDVLATLRQARAEGWYEENLGWDKIDAWLAAPANATDATPRSGSGE